VEAGVVITQEPRAGHRMLKSDSIVLEVGQ